MKSSQHDDRRLETTGPPSRTSSKAAPPVDPCEVRRLNIAAWVVLPLAVTVAALEVAAFYLLFFGTGDSTVLIVDRLTAFVLGPMLAVTVCILAWAMFRFRRARRAFDIEASHIVDPAKVR